ncbi:MAG TPA: RDD family protein [Spirochaetales bacterium]|nr:RDD family protein [Spirochaetales bacterium]
MSDNASDRSRDTLVAARTPEGIEYELKPAGLMARAVAYLVDTLISGAIFTVGAMILTLGAKITGQWIIYLFMFAITWFYHVSFEVFGGGRTPGKRTMGLRVVMPDGSPVSPGASFLRNVLRFADTFMSLYHIAFLTMTASRDFRRLGDHAAGTLVVYARTDTSLDRRARIAWPDWVPTIQPPRALSNRERQTILAFARRYPWLGLLRANEIAAGYARTLGLSDEHKLAPSTYILGLARFLAGVGQ